MSNHIFDLTRKDYKYKGLLFAQIDNEAVIKESGISPPPGCVWSAEIIAMIWTDENNVWNAKMMIIFPSGNMQCLRNSYPNQENVNETKILQEIYKFPMVKKEWNKNDGTIEGMFNILAENGKLEFVKMLNKSQDGHLSA